MQNNSKWKRVVLTSLAVGIGLVSLRAQPATTQIDHRIVNAAFAKGTPLLETNNFKIHASRREKPGLAEIHTRDTDIVYVLEGAATLVTGGKALQPKTIGPAEIRGTGIDGGEVRHIVKGDVVVIPNGVPHWFKEVDGPLLYYVVKVTNE
jgi:glc operon protein GlcG